MLIKKNIAILYICTGKYSRFWESFFLSAERHLFIGHHKSYFVFTDDMNLPHNTNKLIYINYQKKLGWPFDTLMRFSMFKGILNQLKQYDFIFFINANTNICSDISDEVFPQKSDQLVVCLHPGYYNKQPCEYPYDRNKKSSAYIPEGYGKHYFAGGFNGGTFLSYSKLICNLSLAVEIDLSKKVIAKWHDESYLNRYVLDCQNLLILPPSYLYPEDWDIPFDQKVIVLDKNKFGGHQLLRDASIRSPRLLYKLLFRDRK